MSRIVMSTASFGMTLFSLLCCPSMRGNTLIVGQAGTPCPSPGYSTIGAAIAAASPGDTIQICPALYPEQLLITKPLTLQGITQQGVGRVLVQPATLTNTVLPAPVGDLGFMAVISVVNTSGVSIVNLAIDASKNTVVGCTPGLSGIHFFNASGSVEADAISGTALNPQTGCTALFPGNGAGVQADQSDTNSHQVIVLNTSIHDFGRNGVLASGAGETAYISSNAIQGVGPSTGVNQFGVFLALGAGGEVVGNTITQANCGSIAATTCLNQRSEGVILRAAASNVSIKLNVISNVQYGIFVNGATSPVVDANIINNVDFNGVQIQDSVSGVYTGNRVSHLLPGGTCGLAVIPASGSSQNQFDFNLINDAYCGIGYTASDLVGTDNYYLNALYQTLDLDLYTATPNPPPTEPGQ